ncbi:MAG: hypothetical protein ACYTX0_40835 [Nostoc sp.]
MTSNVEQYNINLFGRTKQPTLPNASPFALHPGANHPRTAFMPRRGNTLKIIWSDRGNEFPAW